MNIKLIDLKGRGGDWYGVQDKDNDIVIGEIMNVLVGSSRIIGWTFKLSHDDNKTHKTYRTGKEAILALIKAKNG